MKFKVKVEGLREIDKALGALPGRLGKNVLRETLFGAAEPLRADAAGEAPSRPAGSKAKRFKRKTGGEGARAPGSLKRSVIRGTRLSRAQRQRAADKDTVEVYVGTNDRVSVLEEFGTSDTRPQPFMRPAWERNKDLALSIATEDLATLTEKAVADVAAKAARTGRRGRPRKG